MSGQETDSDVTITQPQMSGQETKPDGTIIQPQMSGQETEPEGTISQPHITRQIRTHIKQKSCNVQSKYSVKFTHDSHAPHK